MSNNKFSENVNNAWKTARARLHCVLVRDENRKILEFNDMNRTERICNYFMTFYLSHRQRNCNIKSNLLSIYF